MNRLWSGLYVTLLRISFRNHVSCMQLLDACNIIPCFGVVCRSKLWPEWSASNFVTFCAFLPIQLPNTVNPQNVYECTLDNGKCTTSHFHNRSTFVTNLWKINLCNGVSLATGRQSGHRGRFTHYNMCWTVRSSNSRRQQSSLLHNDQTSSGAHSTSYSICLFPRDKADGAWSWPPIYIQRQGYECVQLYRYIGQG